MHPWYKDRNRIWIKYSAIHFLYKAGMQHSTSLSLNHSVDSSSRNRAYASHNSKVSGNPWISARACWSRIEVEQRRVITTCGGTTGYPQRVAEAEMSLPTTHTEINRRRRTTTDSQGQAMCLIVIEWRWYPMKTFYVTRRPCPYLLAL